MLVLKGMGKSIPSIVIRDALMNAKSLQLRPTLCDIMDYSLPGSSVHSILQARILDWVAILSQGDLPDMGIKPGSPAVEADSLPSEPPGKPI